MRIIANKTTHKTHMEPKTRNCGRIVRQCASTPTIFSSIFAKNRWRLMITDRKSAEREINRRAGAGEDFVFVISYDQSQYILCHPDEAASRGLFFDFRGDSNSGDWAATEKRTEGPVQISAHPPAREEYHRAFRAAQEEIRAGNTYLINLCFESELKKCPPLSEVFFSAAAPYRLLLKEKFVVFSPEPFVRIEKNGYIKAHPMKGTIDAGLPHASDQLLNDPKERAEHHTIVDLLRNDLAISAREVEVLKFRYLDKIKSSSRALWQTSSEIRGKLPAEFRERLGSILFKMLPAGSISGAPKQKTIEIIQRIENFDRGFYTGIAGIYRDGALDSTVLIRFIEKRDGRCYYKSGGGITGMSDAQSEYEELMAKIYVPVH